MNNQKVTETMNVLRTITIILITSGLGSITMNPGSRAGERTDSVQKQKQIRVVLVGDSTVTDQAGWGGAFGKLFDEQVECINLSAGGRSSLSFRTEGRWTKCLQLKPDYVLIQFGHNDQPGKGPERETDPKTTYRQNMERYVREAREAGIQPILVTSLTRRRFDENGKIRSTLVPYVEAVKQVANERKIPLVDLHSLSIKKCEELGPKGCEAISPATRDGGVDRTHLNAAGAKLIAPLIAGELRQSVPELAMHLRKRSAAEE